MFAARHRQVAMTNGVAHVSFRGGSMFLPARTPYDRQALLDHVGAHLRATGEVQVLFGERRWMVHVERRALPVYCLGCTAPIDAGWYCPDDGGRTYCAKCALGEASPRTRGSMSFKRASAAQEAPYSDQWRFLA